MSKPSKKTRTPRERRIIVACAERDLTRADLMRRVGASESFFYRVLKGTSTSRPLLKRICAELSLDPEIIDAK